MPKTGTSSIQESLYFGLRDRNFRYIDFGHDQTNACRAVATMFTENPAAFYYHQQRGIASEAIERDRIRCHRVLEREIARARHCKETLVISAENGWEMQHGELKSLRRVMDELECEVKVVAYVRPWAAWLQSAFQQQVKMGISHEILPFIARQILDYQTRVELLEDVFSKENVEVSQFLPERFPGGCSVRDFCQSQGIVFDVHRVRRSNDSLSLPAIRLLYTYRKLGPGFGQGRLALLKDWVLRNLLEKLEGPTVRFSNELIAPLYVELEAQTKWLEERFGVAFARACRSEGVADAETIRSEGDLFRYSEESLEWLGRMTGKGSLRGEPVEVAEAMDWLRNHPSKRGLTAVLREVARNKFATWVR
jgi:hypothetical protein